MQRGFNSVVLRGRSRFAESEFNDVATSLIPALNLLIYFLGQVAARLISTVGSPLDGRGKWIVIAISGPPRLDLDRTTNGGSARTTIVVRSYPDHGTIGTRS